VESALVLQMLLIAIIKGEPLQGVPLQGVP
jgi:hypothetical protein